MLNTPLGTIEIKIDGKEANYDYMEIPKDKNCLELDGRYAIIISYIPDGKTHKISCCIKDYIPSDEDFIEPDERLELISLCKPPCKLSAGTEGESWYICDGELYAEYDYDIEYLKTGMQYDIFPETKTKKYVFGIAWMNEANEENEVQTWFGADPFSFRLSGYISK